MPIDWDSIAEPFRVPVGLQIKSFVDAFQLLARTLNQRLEQTRASERASREFPIIRFYNGAVTLWIDRWQHGALGGDAGPPSVWDTLRASGQAFVGGLGRVVTLARQELIIPRLVGTIGDALDAIMASVERFARPFPGMFDVRTGRRASDIFGLLALFVRSFGESTEQIQLFSRGGIAFLGAIRELFPPSPPRPEEASSGGGGFLGLVAAGIVGAILGLPILMRMIGIIAGPAILQAKLMVVEAFAGIEAQLFALRREVIDFTYADLLGFARQGLRFLVAVQVVIVPNVDFLTRFGVEYARGTVRGVLDFMTGLSDLLNGVGRFLSDVATFLTAIENVELVHIFLALLGIPPRYVPPLPFSVTLGDLIDALIGSSASAIRDRLDSLLDKIDDALAVAGALPDFVAGSWNRKVRVWRGKIAALRGILGIVVRPAAPFPAETTVPSLAGVSFPNVFDAFFGPGSHPIGPALVGLRDEVQRGVHDVLGAGVGLLNGLGDAFSTAAARASVLGSPEQYRLIGERASTLAGSLFGPEADDLRRRIASRPPDLLAQAFESWVARGGFDVVGAAIPLYVGEMRRFWEEEADRAATEAPAQEVLLPTSPHITARRARLGRVFVPRLVIRAPGRALDDELVGVVAARFRAAVEGAFQSGQARLAAATGG